MSYLETYEAWLASPIWTHPLRSWWEGKGFLGPAQGEWVTFGSGSLGLGPEGRALVPLPTPAGPDSSFNGPG